MPQPPESAESLFERDVQFLKGVGPKYATLLHKLGLRTAGDVLHHYPRRYEDRRQLPPIRSLRPGMQVTVRGRVVDVDSRATRSRMTKVHALLNDGTGQIMLTWFNQPWLAKRLRESAGEIIAFGTVKEAQWGLEINAPEYEVVEPGEESDFFGRIVPVYASTEGLPQRPIRRAAQAAADLLLEHVTDPLPTSLKTRHHLMDLAQALRNLHSPKDEKILELARRRLVFDEFLGLQLLIQLRRSQTQQEVGIAFPISELRPDLSDSRALFVNEKTESANSLMDEIHQIFPFELTRAQKRVIGEIWKDMERPVPMNRLVQGDVGSGKTAVAASAILAAVRSGYQAAMMAPTEILAEQHYIQMHRLLEPLGIRVQYLVSKLNAKQTKKAQDEIATGVAQVVVGTHSLIQDAVKFHKLGLAIVDEQHRFGVLQRVALRQKSHLIPDVLVMTATPIPRTLAMSFYGDLDTSIIDELPPGRKPIKTHWKKPSQRPEVYEGVRKLLQEGRQAYFVCPAIEESEKLQTQAAVDLHYRLQEQVFPEFKIGLLHGQMKPADKEAVMLAFRNQELDVLVATVVIEVGVDVPNASVMVIEDANRFGLSQLHQIRGRVGRGSTQSFCILIADSGTTDAGERLKVMVDTCDGFKISEADLKLRGPGNLLGKEQSGLFNFKIADLVEDYEVLRIAMTAAEAAVKDDPNLSKPENWGLSELAKARRNDDTWLAVS